MRLCNAAVRRFCNDVALCVAAGLLVMRLWCYNMTRKVGALNIGCIREVPQEGYAQSDVGLYAAFDGVHILQVLERGGRNIFTVILDHDAVGWSLIRERTKPKLCIFDTVKSENQTAVAQVLIIRRLFCSVLFIHKLYFLQRVVNVSRNDDLRGA